MTRLEECDVDFVGRVGGLEERDRERVDHKRVRVLFVVLAFSSSIMDYSCCP